jgi:hypothetical protein
LHRIVYHLGNNLNVARYPTLLSVVFVLGLNLLSMPCYFAHMPGTCGISSKRNINSACTVILFCLLFQSPRQWIFDFLARSSDQVRTVLVVSLWHIWEARNFTRNNPEAPHPRRTADKIKAYVALILQHLFLPVSVHRRETNASSSNWSPPPSGTVMFFSDAAIFSSQNRSGFGVVGRDDKGQFVVACSEPIDGCLEPEMAEAMALRRAVLLAHDEQVSDVIFASDCLSLVRRINSSVSDRSSIGAVVAEIKSMSEGFSSVSFKHVRRLLNVPAHVLAKSCFISSSMCVFYSVPDCIRRTLCNVVH